MYGPPSRFIRLVEAFADENERVEELRREEAQAAEYERQAELLFADKAGGTKVKTSRARGR